MELSREYPLRRQGLLYPMMVIAAIAVIVFSIVGIAAVSGWMPSSLLGETPGAQSREDGGAEPRRPVSAPAGTAFQCAECGVIDTVREIERHGSLASVSLAPHPRPALARAATW